MDLRADTVRAFEAARRRKLARIEPHLRCPRPAGSGRCGARLERDLRDLICTECRTRYPCSEGQFNLLPDELAVLSGIEATENVSSLDYDEFACEMVAEFPEGLILDNGAGLRGEYYENVVNLEIVDYPTTTCSA